MFWLREEKREWVGGGLRRRQTTVFCEGGRDLMGEVVGERDLIS